MEAIKVRKPVFHIEYQKKDITAYISPFVLSLTYTDYLHGKSDEVELSVEDSKNLWKKSWYPEKGDTIELFLGYEGESLLPCGSFQIDEIELSIPPDLISIKCLATSIKRAVRQKNTNSFENITFRGVVLEIAKKHNLQVVGEIEDIKIQRITQKQESDLTFLKTLAEKYGYIFKITGDKLVFYKLDSLEKSKSVCVLKRDNIIQLNLRDKTQECYSACEIQYHDPKENKVIRYMVKAEGIKKGDTLKLNERVENLEQAIIRAKAALHQKNRLQTEGRIVVIGEPKLVAGVNVELRGFHVFDGTYLVETARHSISRVQGYTTEIEVRRL